MAETVSSRGKGMNLIILLFVLVFFGFFLGFSATSGGATYQWVWLIIAFVGLIIAAVIGGIAGEET